MSKLGIKAGAPHQDRSSVLIDAMDSATGWGQVGTGGVAFDSRTAVGGGSIEIAGGDSVAYGTRMEKTFSALDLTLASSLSMWLYVTGSFLGTPTVSRDLSIRFGTSSAVYWEYVLPAGSLVDSEWTLKAIAPSQFTAVGGIASWGAITYIAFAMETAGSGQLYVDDIRWIRSNYMSLVLSEPTLLGYWPMTDASVGFADLSLGAHALVPTGSISYRNAQLLARQPGLGAAFTGGYAEASYSISQQKPLVVEAWVRLDDNTATYRSAVACGKTGEGWAVGTENAGDHLWRFTLLGVVDFPFSVGTTMSTIYHLVFVLDDNDDVSLYMNGAFVATIAGTQTAVASAEGISVGARGDNSEPWSGPVEHVAIYSTLSAAKIAAHYTEGHG